MTNRFIPKRKTVYDLDPHQVNARSARLAFLSSLVWDYAETVRDISITERRQNRRECRLIKMWHDAYQSDMQYAFEGCLAELDRLALQFETLCAKQMLRFLSVLKNECRITEMYTMSLLQCLLILDLMQKFCSGFDRWLFEQGVYGRSTYSILCRNLESTVRAMLRQQIRIDDNLRGIMHTATLIFYNELMAIEMVEDKN